MHDYLKNQALNSREGMTREKIFTRRFKHKLKSLNKHGSVEVKNRSKDSFKGSPEQSLSYMDHNRLSEPLKYNGNKDTIQIKSAVPDVNHIHKHTFVDQNNVFQYAEEIKGDNYQSPHILRDYNLNHSNSEK